MGLDAVEIVMGWESAFGITIADAEAATLRTPGDAIDLIALKLGVDVSRPGACLTQKAFYRLREAIVRTAGIPRNSVRPETKLTGLMKAHLGVAWWRIRAASGLSSLPAPGLFSTFSVRTLVRWAVVNQPAQLKLPGEAWTRSEIRCVVREVVREQTGVEDLADTDDFVHDIGID